MPTVEYHEQPERIIVVSHAQTSALLGWHSGADETEPVDVIVKGPDLWSVQKAVRLVEVAPKMYEALNNVMAAIHQPHYLHTPEDSGSCPTCKALRDAENAIAAACGGVLQRDALRRGK